MRNELCRASEKDVFNLLAQRATEIHLPPMSLPPTSATPDGHSSIIDAAHFGIRLEVPPDALPDGTVAKLSLRTVAPRAVEYLKSGGGPIGELPYSPVVRVDYPAFVDGHELPELGHPDPVYFLKPLTLIVPHSFAPGNESAVPLGAPHGALQWQLLDQETMQMDSSELRIKIPFAGTFCAYSSKEVSDVASARFHIFTKTELPRDDPSSLRVQLCPERSEQIKETEIAEASSWGKCVCVGTSKVLHLCEGSRFKLRYLGQEAEIP